MALSRALLQTVLLKQHQLAMQQSAARLTARLLVEWNKVDHGAIDASWPSFAPAAVAEIVKTQGQTTQLGASFFDAYHFVASTDASRAPKFVPAETPLEQVVSSLDITGRVGMKTAQAGRTLDAAQQTAFVKMAGAAQRITRDSERNGTLATAEHMHVKPRWQRIVSGGHPCRFCTMLAGRGAVYLDEATADFRPHDHCNCATVAVYEGAKPLPPGALAVADVDLKRPLTSDQATAKYLKMEEARQAKLGPILDSKRRQTRYTPEQELLARGPQTVTDYVNWVRRGGRATVDEFIEASRDGTLGRYGFVDTTPPPLPEGSPVPATLWQQIHALVAERQMPRYRLRSYKQVGYANIAGQRGTVRLPSR